MGDCFVAGYYSLYFIERGMDPTQQSILLALVPLSLFVGCFLMSPIANNRATSLVLFRICAILEAALVLSYHFCASFESLVALTIVVSFFNGAPFAFLAGYAAPVGEKYGIQYSRIRLFGTLGYAVSLLLGFFILGSLKIRDCLLISSGLFFLSFGLSFALKAKGFDDAVSNNDEKRPSKRLFSCTLLIFLLAQAFFYGTLNSVYYVVPVAIKTFGGADSDYSLMRGIGVVVEMIILISLPILFKGGVNKRFALLSAVLFGVLGTGIGIFVTNPYLLGYVFFVLSSIGKAMLFAYEAPLLIEIVGEENLGKAMTLDMGSVNLTTTVLNYLSVYLYQNIGFSGYFASMTALEALAIVFLLLIKQKKAPEAIVTTE